MEDVCIICYEKENLIYPLNCNCKIKIHFECIKDLKEKLNLDCPICMKKSNVNNHEIRYIYIFPRFLYNIIIIFFLLFYFLLSISIFYLFKFFIYILF